MNARRQLSLCTCHTIEEASRLADLAPARSFYVSDAWLALLREHGHRYLYTVIRYGDESAAISLSEGSSTRSARYSPAFLLDDRSLDRSHYLVAGPMNGYRNALRFGYRQLSAARAAQGLLDAAADRTILIPYLDTPDAAAFEEAGHPVGIITWETWLDVPQDGFEGYRRGLPKSRREKVTADLRRMDKMKLTFECGPLSDPFGPIARLLVAHEQKYDPAYKGTVEQFECYLRLCAAVPGAYCFTARHSGAMVGAVVAFHYGDALWVRLVGIDESDAAARGCYFSLLFYEPIKLAHQLGANCVHVGIGSLQTKLWRGARAEPLWTAAITAPGQVRGEMRGRLQARAANPPDAVPDQCGSGPLSPSRAYPSAPR